nr:hypothetical protein GCM10020063_102970 [Dactylosporangium thailandense]
MRKIRPYPAARVLDLVDAAVLLLLLGPVAVLIAAAPWATAAEALLALGRPDLAAGDLGLVGPRPVTPQELARTTVTVLAGRGAY